MTKPARFVFNKDHKDTEQVRPYFADYMRLYEALVEKGHYPYNDSFWGQIPGLAGSPDEERGIYLLQTLRSLEDMRQRAATFKDEGGCEVTSSTWPAGIECRGTLARYGWYITGTGWEVLDDVRVKIDEKTGDVMFKLPRQRQWRQHFSGGTYLFKDGDR